MEPSVKKKIKIAQVITRLDWSGAPDILGIICSRLDPSIYDVTLVYGPTAYPTEKTKGFLKKFGGKVIIIPPLKREVSLFEDVAALAKLYALFRHEKFDIVHTHTAKAGFMGRLAAKAAGVPMVIHTPHGHDFYGYFNTLGSNLVILLEKVAAFFADKIVVFTALEKADMLKYHVCPAGKIDIIRSGINISAFERIDKDPVKKRSEFNIGPGESVVGTVGRLESIKGLEYFIESARIVLEAVPETKFLVVGDGSLHGGLVERAKRLGIDKSVIFTGWRDDMPEMISAFDILVLASLNEAVGRVLLEAGAAGKPAVATTVGGIPEIIRDGETGILVPPMDPERMARAVIKLLKDEKARRAMGQAARDWVRGNFDENAMFEMLDKFYRGSVKR